MHGEVLGRQSSADISVESVMGCSAMPAVLLTLGVYLAGCAAPGAAAPAPQRRRVLAPLLRARLEPLTGDILLDDDDPVDLTKRQFDDYGHMRFGKRGDPDDKFDDYGHMRFGRAHV